MEIHVKVRVGGGSEIFAWWGVDKVSWVGM